MTTLTDRVDAPGGVSAGGGRVPSRGIGRPRAWQAILVVGSCLVAAYFAVPGGQDQDFAYSGIGVASTVAMLVAIRVRRPDERLGWYLVAAANACFVLGDAVYLVYDAVLHTGTPFPSVADALYLAGYPFLIVGVRRISRVRGVRGARESWADAAMVSVGALALSWHLLMGTYAGDGTLSRFGKIVTLAYPVMDIGVLFLVASAMMSSGLRRGADTLLAAAVSVMLVADFVYDLLVLHSSYTSGSPIDAAFLLNYVLLAAAAAHPSVALRRTAKNDLPGGGAKWLPLIAVSAVMSPLIILLSTIFGWHVDAGVLSATSIILAALAAVRARWLFRRLKVQTRRAGPPRGVPARGTRHATEPGRRSSSPSFPRQPHRPGQPGPAARSRESRTGGLAATSGNVAVCFIDLDGFKGVNDSMGHQLGDQLLVNVSRRLAGIVRAGDTVARLGGDEFAILLENVESFDTVTTLAERVVLVLREPTTIDGHQIYLSASVGVAFAGMGTTTETLLSEADAAMYDAKNNGKDRFAMFETVMRSRILDRMTLVNSFQDSLQRGEFFLEYQPQLRLSDGALTGFEALVRWQHPTLGLVGPYRFIPLAEETGFIVPLGRWVLEQACLEAMEWHTTTSEPLTVSVNVSGRQLQDPNLLQDVRTALAFSGLPPQRLILEITESVLTLNQADILHVLRGFQEIGIRIAIDDFGTGYSSLSYLRDFPVDILKIDKSFVDLLADSSGEGTTFVQTILRLAEDLHLDATAEGIEHQAQRETLTRLNCHSGQGYLMSRPLRRDAALDYIAAVRTTDGSLPTEARLG